MRMYDFVRVATEWCRGACKFQPKINWRTLHSVIRQHTGRLRWKLRGMLLCACSVNFGLFLPASLYVQSDNLRLWFWCVLFVVVVCHVVYVFLLGRIQEAHARSVVDTHSPNRSLEHRNDEIPFSTNFDVYFTSIKLIAIKQNAKRKDKWEREREVRWKTPKATTSMSKTMTHTHAVHFHFLMVLETCAAHVTSVRCSEMEKCHTFIINTTEVSTWFEHEDGICAGTGTECERY